ncbi:hypothetical protein QTO34_007563, partial [Cnephaeus nilssonii]
MPTAVEVDGTQIWLHHSQLLHQETAWILATSGLTREIPSLGSTQARRRLDTCRRGTGLQRLLSSHANLPPHPLNLRALQTKGDREGSLDQAIKRAQMPNVVGLKGEGSSWPSAPRDMAASRFLCSGQEGAMEGWGRRHVLLRPNCRQTPPRGVAPPAHRPTPPNLQNTGWARCPRGLSVPQHSHGADAELASPLATYWEYKQGIGETRALAMGLT